VGCPQLSTLWASDAATLCLWSRGEKEVEILRRLSPARSGLGSCAESLTQGTITGIFL
jgi:hypothetical protein